MSENSCQLCAVEKLTFEPPPIYCTPCGARIKRNAMYHTVGAGDTRHYFCIPCYNDARGDVIVADGTTIPKSRLEKKKNDEETEEWVCSICSELWLILDDFLMLPLLVFLTSLMLYFSGFNVINVKHGNIRSVLFSMAEEMMVVKLSIPVQIVTFKKLKGESVYHYLKVLFLALKNCLEQFSVIT